MTRKDRPRGCDSPGPEDAQHGGGESIAIVATGHVRELRRLSGGRWFGAMCYDPPVGRRHRGELICPGEFGDDGRWRPHCGECAA